MAVKLELYRIFRAVADTGNISRAARQLYISQSAVSQSVRQLEQQLQTRLFARTARGVTLTDDGRLLYDYVSKALELVAAGEARLTKARALELGHLAIGASDTLTRRYLLPYLKAFHQDYPAVELEIRNGTSQGVLELLRSGQVDVAFASQVPDLSVFSARRCFETHLVFAAAPDYDCDFDHPYTLAELAALPLILLDHNASSRRYLEQIFLEQGVRLRPAFELGTHDLQIALARIGLGVAIVTEEFSRSTLERGVIRKLQTAAPIPPRSVELCTLRGVEPTAAAQTFMALLTRPAEGGAG